MACEYCLREIGHNWRCPNCTPLKTSHYCSVCGECIENGEEYIVNDFEEYAHLWCVNYSRDLAKFLGYEIKEMEDYSD